MICELLLIYSEKNDIIYYRVFQKKVAPPKTFWNIFTSVKSFCVKFCRFVGNSCPHNLPFFVDLS